MVGIHSSSSSGSNFNENVTVCQQLARAYELADVHKDKSLKGEKGIPGLNGINGKDGNNGIKGETWVPSYQNGKIKFSLNNNYIISDDLRSKCTTNGSSLKWMQQCP